MPDIEALTAKLMKDPDFKPKAGKTKLETAQQEATQRINQHRKNAAALAMGVDKKTATETLSEYAKKQEELKEVDEMLFGVPSEDDREAMERELDIIELDIDRDIKLAPPPKNTSSQVKEELKTIIDLHLQTKEETENFEIEISKPAKLQDLNIIKAFTNLAEELGLSDEITKEELRPIIKETAMIVMNLKYKFNRPRPFQLMDFHNVEFEPADFKSSKTPAYPSGHSFQGALIAMILSQIFPLHEEKFTKLGESIGDNRVIFGVHYPSDNYAGIELAKQVYPFVNFDKLGFQAIPQESEPLEKSLPPNAVYSSEENPPEGTQIFYTENQNKPYWIRSPKQVLYKETIDDLIKNPSKTIDNLIKTDKFPEINSLRDVHQRSDAHPEGDVLTHTKMVVEEAKKLVDTKDFSQKEKETIILASLAHDFGKPETTDEKGSAIDHDKAGVEPTVSFLNKITDDKELIGTVASLVRDHLIPAMYHRERDAIKEETLKKFYNKKIEEQGPNYIKLLSTLSRADMLGRGKLGAKDEAADWFENKMESISSEKLEKEDNPRIPRKEGQPAKSDKHSDLYTDEDPKDTIQGLGFKDVKTAEASVNKIKKSGRTHAHKIQAAVAMEQRAKAAGKTTAAGVYRKYINEMKEKTQEKEIEKHSEEHHTVEHTAEEKPFNYDDAIESIGTQIEQIKNKIKTGDYGIEKADMPLEKATGVEIAATGAALVAGGLSLWDLYQTFKNNKRLTRDQRIELDETLEANEEEIKSIQVNFNENQELPDLEDTDNVAEIVEAAKDPEKAEDVVKKVRKKRWDAGKTAEEKQKIREERDKRRESTAQPLAPVGELTPELDIDSVLRQAEDSGLMDHIHEQIEGHGKDNPFHTKEDTVKAIKAKYKTPEKMKEYLGKQHGKFETFKAKAKATEEKQEAKAKADADPNKKRWDLSNANEDEAYETAKEMIAHTLAHSSEHGGDGLDDKSVKHINNQLGNARKIMGSDNVKKLNNELKNNEIKPAKLDEEKVKEDYEGSDIPPEARGYGAAPEGVRVYTGPEDGKFYDKREAEKKEGKSEGGEGDKSEGKGKDMPLPEIPKDIDVSSDKPVGDKASSWGDAIGSDNSALGRFGSDKGDDKRSSLIDSAVKNLKEAAKNFGAEFSEGFARNIARSRGYGEAEAKNAQLKYQLQAAARGVPLAGRLIPATEGYKREARAGAKGAAREEAAKQRAAEDKLRFGDNIDFEVNKSDVKKLQDFLRKRV